MGEPADPLALHARTGLPDALRVLLRDYPREAWQESALSPLIRFWLDRHMMFRKLSDRLTRDARDVLDGRADPAAHAATLSRLGALFVQELHGHHHVEDAQYFPVLARHESRLERGFALLDDDHHALDGHLSAYVARANDVVRADGPDRHDDRNGDRNGATGRYLQEMERFAPLLERHLTDEEDLVVPVLLKHGERGLG
jgi:iron-sulfur cluster repair protein YtfE (RIC family)